MRDTKKMLKKKLFASKRIYKFGFYQFLIKCTVFVLVVVLNKFYKHVEYFLIGITVFFINIENALICRKFNFFFIIDIASNLNDSNPKI